MVGPDGRETVRFHGLFIGLSGVSEGQLIQETRTNFTVSVVATATYTEGDAREIRDRLIQRLGPQIELTVRVVPEIPRERNGKFRAVISRVHREAPTL